MSEDDEPEILDEDELSDDEAPPTRLSIKQVAQFLGRSISRVRQLQEEGRLVSLTPKGKKQWFALADVQRLVSEIKAEKRELAPVLPPAAAVESARANHVQDIVVTSTSHSEEFFKLSISAMRNANEELRKAFTEANEFHAREHKRLTDRITTLESERSEYLEKLDEMRRTSLAEDEKRMNAALVRETFNEGKTLLKAIIASKMAPGVAKEGLQAGSVAGFIQSLKPAQLDTIVGALTPEQFAMLTAILESMPDAQAEKKEAEKKEAAA